MKPPPFLVHKLVQRVYAAHSDSASVLYVQLADVLLVLAIVLVSKRERERKLRALKSVLWFRVQRWLICVSVCV